MRPLEYVVLTVVILIALFYLAIELGLVPGMRIA